MASRQRLISWLHPYSTTSNVVLNLCSRKTIGLDVRYTPSNNLMSPSSNSPAHVTRRVSHPSPTCVICLHPDPGKCPRTFPLSARLYVQCQHHISCHVLTGPHTLSALCLQTDAYVQPWESVLIPLVTPRLLKTHQPTLLWWVGTSTHNTFITFFVLGLSLRIKGVTRRFYCWFTKTYNKFASPLLN